MKLSDLLSSNPRRNPFGFLALALLLAYVALLATPGLLFAESTHMGAFTLYSHQPMPGLAADVRKAQALVAQSSIDDPALPQKFVLTASIGEMSFFAPGSRRVFGVTYPILGTSMLAPSDAATDQIHANHPGFNLRPLSAVIAHERTHRLLEHHFGALRAIGAPTWKQEGYCDYIAGGASIPDLATGLALLNGARRYEPAVIYFRDTLRVRFLLERQHVTVDQLFTQSFDEATLDRQAIAAFTPTAAN